MQKKLSKIQKLNFCSQIRFDPSKYNFKHESTEYIKDFNLTQHIFTHNKTGTKYQHVQNSDPNNLFAIQFRTLPENHKGVPHILEHMALCGSKSYPVRDPFFKMIKRSLNTFMNAFTCPDLTCYPFSTQNEKDFTNLLNIYLDASLNPLLNENDFYQEGWRLDIENDKVVFKGVVYNEMKGVYQNPSSFYSEELMNELYPKNSIYSKKYGGNPNDIVTLSYKELKEFHQKYYHPSNAQILTYGNMNIENHMQTIDKYIGKFDKLQIDSTIPSTQKFQEIKNVVVKSPNDQMAVDPNKQTKFNLSYLCNDINSPYETLSLKILNSLLFDAPNGALYKALIESQKANSFGPCTGYEIFLKEGLLSIGVDQISEDQIDDIEQTIQKTLQEKFENGFDKKEIDAILHQIEIRNKMPKSNFGLSLLYSQIANINHNVTLKDSLDLNNNLQKIRENVDKGLFQNLIKKYILDNKHCLRLKMIVDEKDNYQTQHSNIEKQQLQEIQQKLTQQQKDEIIAKNEILKKDQDQKDKGIELLPSLQTSDINRTQIKYMYEKRKIGNSSVYLFDQDTNGLTFLRIKIDAKDVQDKKLMKLLCSLYGSLGTKDVKHDVFQQQLQRYTTNFGISFNSDQQMNKETKDYYLMSIACLDQNIDQMFSLLKQIFNNPDFNDSDHIINLMQQIGAQLSESIQQSPLNYGLNYAASGLVKSQNNLNMINESRFLNKICKQVNQKNDDLTQLQQNLNQIHQKFLSQDKLDFSIHSKKDNFDYLQNKIDNFIQDITPKSDQQLIETQFQPIFYKKYFELPLQVNFAIESFQSPHYLHEDCPKMHILSQIFLFREIREKGGAYGSGCRFSSEGFVSFFSYRDPNHLKTYEAFQKSIDYILEQPIKQSDLDEAKLCLFQKYDSLVSPQNRGLGYFLSDITYEQKQKYREQVLDSSIDQIKTVCEKYLKNQKSSKVIFGGSQNKPLFEEANDNWVFDLPISDQ